MFETEASDSRLATAVNTMPPNMFYCYSSPLSSVNISGPFLASWMHDVEHKFLAHRFIA